MIRELTIDDVDRIAQIEQQEQINPIPFKTLYQWFSNGYLGFGLDDGLLYGYTISSPIVNKQTYSVITCIVKAYQNRKEGRLLCQYALEEGKKRGAESILFEVRRSNIAELSMVKHFGAYVINEKLGYYGDGEDALVMRIEL